MKINLENKQDFGASALRHTTTHTVHAIKQLKWKCREYNIQLCVAFVDYEKVFDSVKTQAILTSLQEKGIEILKEIYTNSSVTVHLHKESETIRIKRGVRQGDTISPKLFTATPKSVFRRLNWENKGVKVDGEFLTNLRFADDIIILMHRHSTRPSTDATRYYTMKVGEWVLR